MDIYLQEAVRMYEVAQDNFNSHSDYETVRSNAGYYLYQIVYDCIYEQIYLSKLLDRFRYQRINEQISVYDLVSFGKSYVREFILTEEIERALPVLIEWKEKRYDPYFAPTLDDMFQMFPIVKEYLEKVKAKEEAL
ncbi:MAG: hypothetical protein ACI4CS_04540 [Candidatus Weimeria sp.]